MDTTRDLNKILSLSVFVRNAEQRLTISRSFILRLKRVRHSVSMMLADTVTNLSGLRDEQN
jgi:hypothetical protein